MKKIDILFIVFFCALIVTGVHAQISGKTSFSFLNMPPSARITGLGGSVIGVADDDINLSASNPANLNTKMAKQFSFSHGFHFADVQYGFISYGHYLRKLGLMAGFGIQYIGYGDFIATNDRGIEEGQFGAGDQCFSLTLSKRVAERIHVGATLKFANSHIENFGSKGILADVGLTYGKDSSNWNLSFVVKNVGYELSTYNGDRYGTPLDVQIGITKKLSHLPLRFAIIGHHLHLANVVYDDPNTSTQTDIFGESIERSAFSKSIDNIFRHILVNGEFLLGKSENLKLRIAYDHWRRKELSLTTFRSLAGFSGGVGISIKGFKIDYGVGYYHVAGATNHLSVRVNMDRFFSKV